MEFTAASGACSVARKTAALLPQTLAASALTHMHNAIFLNPLTGDPGPRNRAVGEITGIIDSTSELVRIAIAYFNYPEIAKALETRTKKELPTQLLLNTSDLLRPVSPGESQVVVPRALVDLIQLGSPLEIQSLGLHTKVSYQNMHHKFLVAPQRLVFGSMNWTQAALHRNFEVVIISDEQYLIKEFSAHFDELWTASERFFAPGGKVRTIMCPVCESADGVDFESWGAFCTVCKYKFQAV